MRLTGAREIKKKNGKKQCKSFHNYWISAQRKEKIYSIANVAGSEETNGYIPGPMISGAGGWQSNPIPEFYLPVAPSLAKMLHELRLFLLCNRLR
jgi:hypothetical protein